VSQCISQGSNTVSGGIPTSLHLESAKPLVGECACWIARCFCEAVGCVASAGQRQSSQLKRRIIPLPWSPSACHCCSQIALTCVRVHTPSRVCAPVLRAFQIFTGWGVPKMRFPARDDDEGMTHVS
jgi:hypothetical protein